MSNSGFLVVLGPAAKRDRGSAEAWWLDHHGPIAPSRLERELADAVGLLAATPRIGFPGTYRGRSCLKYRLAGDFFLVYSVRPRRREVMIHRILAASRLHG